MSLSIKGKIHKVFDVENKSGTFKSKNFVLETVDGNYSNYITFQLVQDRTDLLTPLDEGDEKTVHFDLRGREWNGKYFNTLNAWKIE